VRGETWRWSSRCVAVALAILSRAAFADPPTGAAGRLPATAQPTVGTPVADELQVDDILIVSVTLAALLGVGVGMIGAKRKP